MHPQDRVAAFLADFAREHARIRPLFDELTSHSFDAWAEALAGVAARHGTPNLDLEASSFRTPAPHVPDNITIGKTRETASGVVVAAKRGFPPANVSYHLVAVGDEWRLDQVKTTYPGASAKAITAGEAKKRLALADPSAPLAPLGPDDRADPGVLFGGREVIGIGTFETSGVLAVGDFGYDLADQPVLSRRVPAGTCTGEYVSDQGVVAALRVRFSDEKVASWALAESEHGHVVGVDSGTVAVVDFAAAAGLTVTGKENAEDKAFEAVAAAVLRSRKGAFGVQVTSGWGDGAYPVYWGVGVDGTPVQVVVDLLVMPS